jgi:rare lipoprotein A
VRVATGRPTAVGNTPAPTAIDRLLSGLPIASANASERPPQAAPAAAVAAPVNPRPAGERFDMRQDGRTMSADEFDAWLASRRLRVATGKPGTPGASVPPAVIATPRVVTTAPAIATPPAATPTPPSAAVPTDATAVTYQVASFAARTNAEHALSILANAGIQGGRLLDADANGRKVWRLRVGPVDASSAPELVARIAGLGFGQPQRVRE